MSANSKPHSSSVISPTCVMLSPRTVSHAGAHVKANWAKSQPVADGCPRSLCGSPRVQFRDYPVSCSRVGKEDEGHRWSGTAGLEGRQGHREGYRGHCLQCVGRSKGGWGPWLRVELARRAGRSEGGSPC
eukprot:scaffold178031_cov28-Tisochrysis_lutea.AAC.2